MKVTMLRAALQRLEEEGRGDCDLYVFPTKRLQDISQRPGYGTMLGFDDGDYAVESVDESFTQPEDAQVIFLEFGSSNQEKIKGRAPRPREPAEEQSVRCNAAGRCWTDDPVAARAVPLA